MAEDSVDRGLEDINILKKSGSVKDAVFGVLYTLR